jgi:hypothetical protein
MPKDSINGREPDFSEDDIQREQFGPRSAAGKDDPAKMTPQREKKQSKPSIPAHSLTEGRHSPCVSAANCLCRPRS